MKRITAKHRPSRGGFTLIEVLLVLAILGVIAAMVVPNLLGRQQEANIKATKQSIHSVENAAKLFATEHDAEWPQNINELLLQENIGGVPKPAYLDKPPLDAWGMPIQYEYTPGEPKPRIYSFGPNKQQGGGDDITNYDDDPNYNGQQI